MCLLIHQPQLVFIMNNKYNIRFLLVFLIASLSSCTPALNETPTILPDTIQLKADPGMVRTVMDETARITEYDLLKMKAHCICPLPYA